MVLAGAGSMVGKASATRKVTPRTAGATTDDLVEAMVQGAEEITVGRTAKEAGDFVHIRVMDGTVANIRVESHPPRGVHGNVQVWKHGEEVMHKHVEP